MNKTVKTIGITAALAVMIPLSAYAATNAATSTTTSTAASTTLAANAAVNPVGERGFGLGGRGGFVSQEVLDLLKLDQAALKEKLAAGKTLAAVADEQGVTRDQLKQALTKAFDAKQAAEKTQFTTNLDSMIDSNKLDKAGFKGGFGAVSNLADVAKLFSMTETELNNSLAGGKTLAAIATEKGVDTQKVIDLVKTGIDAQIKQAVTDGKLTQAQADTKIANSATMAQNIVNGTGFGGGHRGGHRGGFGGWGPAPQADQAPAATDSTGSTQSGSQA
ncbi:hypothetical protein KZ483_10010 [Paenibacillus sp. sptzw28]|uniref:hypothetical protein n=1 Tax=Paenibacillus sp. sptzw28 TaxID=715179 RepID=UPI001C6EF87C|nr:hypothetical protein [Paenibacillus sp. sptzw28]QYR23217.1 hypothetical protein KZ483_10010 [Paenibacillus sp. sptzw28]